MAKRGVYTVRGRGARQKCGGSMCGKREGVHGRAGGTHPTEMHSCFLCLYLLVSGGLLTGWFFRFHVKD